MTDVFTSTRIDEQWIRIDCSDYETGDQFDDYLTEELGSGLIAKTGQSPRERMRIGTGLRIGHSG